MARLFLIRHGRQSSKLCNVDVDLSPEGFRQAALVGERLSSEKIQAVYSSNLIRAVQTAQSANQYWNVEHRIYPELREISYGDMEGLSSEQTRERFKDFYQERRTSTQDIPYPGGECAGDVVKRAMPVLKEIAESGHSRIAVVTHGGLIRCVVASILGMDLAKWKSLGSHLENGSITEINYHSGLGRFSLERFNDYAHLEPYPELLRKSWLKPGESINEKRDHI